MISRIFVSFELLVSECPDYLTFPLQLSIGIGPKSSTVPIYAAETGVYCFVFTRLRC